ncbi:MAG: hypothetical protein K2M75_02685, partial [Clostridia bacterium]|nr:hypothetical protein [Clostridia bacterium]
MENELSKKEFLSNLYALRAGLSVISQINDEIENRANVVESKDWYIEESTGIWGFFFPTNIDKSKKLKEFETITKLYNYNYNYYNDISGEADQEKRNEYFSKINMIQRMIFCDWLNTNEAEEYFISKKDGAINKCNQCQKKLEQMKNDAEDYENKIQFSLEQKKKYNMLAVLTIPTIIG